MNCLLSFQFPQTTFFTWEQVSYLSTSLSYLLTTPCFHHTPPESQIPKTHILYLFFFGGLSLFSPPSCCISCSSFLFSPFAIIWKSILCAVSFGSCWSDPLQPRFPPLFQLAARLGCERSLSYTTNPSSVARAWSRSLLLPFLLF